MESLLEDRPYFTSLDQLDTWASKPSLLHTAVLRFMPRSLPTLSQKRGKLLVCHDYKGGYTEKPNGLSYTFNFWSCCDIFIYFAHHRVTVPPPGWITAAHRQGSKMLGTIIFEGGAEADCLRLLVGKLPTTPSGPAVTPAVPHSLPVSPHYARILADLAHSRGFDGYLLNFECPLQGSLEQTRALVAWIALLRQELVAKIGPHAEVSWYDSVILNGQLRWQDRLNSLNLPFFLPATSFFTNYTWPRDYPSQTAQYFFSLDENHLGKGSSTHPLRSPAQKSLQDVYLGIDVWGRGSHGGGGFGSYKALSHIDPQSLGLSVALFGPAWTWESEQDKPGWNWNQWWDYERRLWVGAKDDSEVIHVPEAPRREGESECIHGPFAPLHPHFNANPPPDPIALPFHTTFSPGVGQMRFVDGMMVANLGADWWTDLSKQTSLGDVWPKPSVLWEGGIPESSIPLPRLESEICMTTAWNGGSSLRVQVSAPGSNEDNAAFRCVWLPIQRLSVTTGRKYSASLVYKIERTVEVDLDIAFSAKSILSAGVLEIDSSSASSTDLHDGWVRTNVDFSTSGLESTDIFLGLIISMVAYDPSSPLEAALLLGQVDVRPTRSPFTAQTTPIVLWATFQSGSSPLTGKLSWETASTQPPIASITLTSPEDPNPAFLPLAEEQEQFMYFHIYAKRYMTSDHVGGPEDAVWVGSTGWEGQANIFSIDKEKISPLLDRGDEKVRVYVRGFTDWGRLVGWEEAAYVDIT